MSQSDRRMREHVHEQSGCQIGKGSPIFVLGVMDLVSSVQVK